MEDDDVSSRCAICLCEPDALDVAFVKACLHRFCAPCVARWARFCSAKNARAGVGSSDGSEATCPCCKTPFDSVLVYRALDGEASLDGEMIEESLCLLQRAEWVVERRARWEDDAAFAARDDVDDDHAHDDDYLDDDEIAFSGRRKTLVLGNRRFGRGGYISNSGRVFARPTGASSSPASGKKKPTTGASGKSPVPSTTKPPKHTGASSSSSSPGVTSSVESRSARSPSPAGSDADGSTPRQRGRKSQKRADAKARKVEQERSRAAARLKRLEDEAAEKEAAKAAARAAREALEALALEAAV